MNQPASKEPTMDEILSSIRQIIADDDEAASRKVAPAPAASGASPMAARPAVIAEQPPRMAPAPNHLSSFDEIIDPFEDDEDDAVPPLTLTPDQIVAENDEPATPEPVRAPEVEPVPVRAAVVAEPVRIPEPIAAPVPDSKPAPAPAAAIRTPEPTAVRVPEPVEMPEPASFRSSDRFGGGAPEMVDPDDIAFMTPEPAFEPAPRPMRSSASISHAAPLPDPDLTRDLAEQLLEPTTGAAVRTAFARLNAPKLTPETPVGAGGLTIETMLREMLRPMLKDWLDENLPAMVERIVEQEIERVSRGGR